MPQACPVECHAPNTRAEILANLPVALKTRRAMHYEVELKFWVDDQPALRRALLSLGAEAPSSQVQIDSYFEHPARSFAQTDEALRVRQVQSRCLITYKGPKIDAATKTRVELELELAPGTA